ncbi:hypothetical protein [Pseudomonas sp. LP_7_YM]|uniref:hypothetical protein n=1 Tax=Pseudomonas sp. LP_7_YM TaxID=2485137 RepID=UPI0010601864|nr:hypothetical protein [Pseudomonas sp. LP_7_YM]TDV69870.1 hypothetical protein EC915_102128 [Pseudomonas sp. LP_7_YM]
MKMICIHLAFCLLLQGCSSAPSTPHAPGIATALQTSHIAQSPEEVVASLNRLYNDDQKDCREIGTDLPRGHYYCSGLLIRATSDGDYLPWTSSPGAIAQGGAAFSWIRKDMHPGTMLNPSGFILRNAKEGERYGLPGYDAGLICLYPFDASTSGNMRHNGCGRQGSKPTTQAVYPQPGVPHRNAAYAWGSCEDIGIRTVAEWVEYTGDLQAGDTHNQCSWNVDSQTGWNNALAIAPLYPSLDFIWNELIMATVDDGYSLKDYIPAVFLYAPSREEGLEAARNFQRKLAANGNTVPIVRLDYQARQPFSYHVEDQAIAGS